MGKADLTSIFEQEPISDTQWPGLVESFLQDLREAAKNLAEEKHSDPAGQYPWPHVQESLDLSGAAVPRFFPPIETWKGLLDPFGRPSLAQAEEMQRKLEDLFDSMEKNYWPHPSTLEKQVEDWKAETRHSSGARSDEPGDGAAYLYKYRHIPQLRNALLRQGEIVEAFEVGFAAHGAVIDWGRRVALSIVENTTERLGGELARIEKERIDFTNDLLSALTGGVIDGFLAAADERVQSREKGKDGEGEIKGKGLVTTAAGVVGTLAKDAIRTSLSGSGDEAWDITGHMEERLTDLRENMDKKFGQVAKIFNEVNGGLSGNGREDYLPLGTDKKK